MDPVDTDEAEPWKGRQYTEQDVYDWVEILDKEIDLEPDEIEERSIKLLELDVPLDEAVTAIRKGDEYRNRN